MRTGGVYFQNQVGKNKKKTPESLCFCSFISMTEMKRTDSSAAMICTQAACFSQSAANRHFETEF